MDMMFRQAALTGRIPAPASKSEAHRRLICAGLTGKTTVISGFMMSEDMKATIRCLTALGASVTTERDRCTVHGIQTPPAELPVMDCGESGSTLRFFVPIALAVCGGGIFRMHGRLGKRPMDIYRDLFVPRGISWQMTGDHDGVTELRVEGTMQAGEYVLPGNVSSQFVSGLLFALPLLEGDSVLKVLPPVESVGYIDMTLEAIRGSGITIGDGADNTWSIPGRQRYQAADTAIAGDYSQAAVLLCADALGQQVLVTGLKQQTTQGDRAVLKHLMTLGCSVKEDENGLRVTPATRCGVLNVQDCPDIAPILALVCQLLPGESRLEGCGRLRLKESDRLAETVAILNELGGDARVEGDTMVINGCEMLAGGVTVSGRNDHRMVMLLSIAALYAEKPVTVTGVEALNKSWPDYLEMYRLLGGQTV